MIDLTSGSITVDGVDIATRDAALLRRSIGYVIQQAGLFPHRTVIENIMTVPNLVGANRGAARRKAVELMERVGLDPSFGSRFPAQLSGGQAQRVGVARALAADPPIMLMDEPFSAIDPIVRDELQREFLRLQSQIGKTIVFVTHDIDEAIKLGDQVAIFRQGGELVQFASPQELLASPTNEFVAGFVGRDRGFRGLSFLPAAVLAVRPLSQLKGLGPQLVIGEKGAPSSWSLAGRTFPISSVDVFRSEDTLRRVTDLTIVSPVGIALRVDESGAADGWVTQADVAEHIERVKEARRDD
jgi:osmoprotectant transport system ATP-binding protein